jgi:uncharacterized membrane protein
MSMSSESSAFPSTTRIEALSDAVIAIIITIMVLDLGLPKESLAAGFWDGLVVPLVPRLIPYLLSFSVIAIIWVRHHLLLHTAVRATRALLWSNIHLLLWMSVIPVTTAALGENPSLPLAVAMYGFVLAGNALAFLVLRWSVYRDTGNRDMRRVHVDLLRRDAFVAALYTLSMPLAFVSIYLSLAIFVLMPGLFFLPDLFARSGGAAK